MSSVVCEVCEHVDISQEDNITLYVIPPNVQYYVLHIYSNQVMGTALM